MISSGNGDIDTPAPIEHAVRRATRLEWLTLAYLASAIAVVAVVMGQSEAMKTAWLDDIISIVPPIAFLASTRFAWRRPNRRFPYGYLRSASIAFLAGSLALCALAVFLMIESGAKLVAREHPTVGGVQLFGHHVWLGWLMLPALAWSGVPAIFLGRAKVRLARRLSDKGLLADADMNKADWCTAAAAIAGIVGIAFGLWWADSVCAMLIASTIGYDGVKNLRRSVQDLMNRAALTLDGSVDPLTERIDALVAALPWVRDHRVRLRSEGRRLAGDILVVPSRTEDLVELLEDARAKILALDWRVEDIVIAPVAALPAA